MREGITSRQPRTDFMRKTSKENIRNNCFRFLKSFKGNKSRRLETFQTQSFSSISIVFITIRFWASTKKLNAFKTPRLNASVIRLFVTRARQLGSYNLRVRHRVVTMFTMTTEWVQPNNFLVLASCISPIFSASLC